MDLLRRQVRRARRRLLLGRFVAAVTWTLFAALLVAVAAIALPKVFALGVDAARWPWFWLGGAVGLALVVAAVWTWLTGGGELDAAIEVDLRYDLKERVSSGLTLGLADRDRPAGQALIKDAMRALERIDVGDRFPIAIGRSALLLLVPATVAFLLVLCVDDRSAANKAAASVTNEASKQIKKSTDTLRRKLVERREQARKEGLKDAGELLEKLEQGTRELTERKDIDKKQALVKLNDLARQLEQRRQQIGGDRSVRQHLDQLRQLKPGPADRLAQALRKGDFNGAAEQLKRLQEELRSDGLDAEDKAKLAEQLGQMQEKLRKLADAHQAATDSLRDQIQRARDAGNPADAQRLQQMLDRLAAQMPQMDQLQELADQLGLCAQCMQQGNNEGALDALGKLAGDLAAMQESLDELQMLDDALAHIGECKDAISCTLCAGAGCPACQGQGEGQGQGLGEGQGVGPRPEEQDDTKAYDSRVRQQPGRGRAVVADLVDGPNVRGRVMEAIQAEFDSGGHRDADPLADRRLPRAYREHAQQFFDRFREGKD